MEISTFEIDGLKIDLVRDDLFPRFYGGNKARKAVEYERELLAGGYNALVTTGGIQSNHCRVMALLAASHHWACHIVYHGTKERFLSEKGNAAIVRQVPFTADYVAPNQISDAMDQAMEKFREEGLKPYYVTGGGHDLPGGIAYTKAIDELEETLGDLSKVDRIFLPCGTGSTQGGIVAGLAHHDYDDIDVIGISVARNKGRAMEVTSEFVDRLAQHYHLNPSLSERVLISDDFLMGGYEGTTPEVCAWLDKATRDTGVLFDPTYSGKALWGMHQLIRDNGWEKDKNIFWLTGGLFNCLV